MLRSAASPHPPPPRLACALAILVVGLGACAPSGGGDERTGPVDNDDGRNGQVEEHIDPGPYQIADAFSGVYVAAGSAVPDTLRGLRVWLHLGDREWADSEWVYAEHITEGRPAERRVYRVGYDHSASRPYTVQVYAVPDGLPPLPPDIEPMPRIRADDPLDGVTPDDLVLRPGCTLVFERDGPGDYLGVTDGTACPPDDPSASHSMTEVVIDDDGLSIWSRDVGADSAYVAGPTSPTAYRRPNR